MGDNFVCVGQKPTRKCPAGDVVGTTEAQTLTNKTLGEGCAVPAEGLALAEGSIFVGNDAGAPAALSVKNDGRIIVGNGTTVASVALSGDATLNNAGVLTVASKAINPAKMADLAQGSILAGGASNAVTVLDAKTSGQILVGDGTDLASVAVSGDATLAANGTLTLGEGVVTSGKLANGAGVAALLAAGLGASANYPKETDGAQTLLENTSGGDLSCLIVCMVTETFADGSGSKPEFQIGKTGSPAIFGSFVSGESGSVYVYPAYLVFGEDAIVTGVPATGDGTGAISVTVLALPAGVAN
jgi:hypothetical protein